MGNRQEKKSEGAAATEARIRSIVASLGRWWNRKKIAEAKREEAREAEVKELRSLLMDVRAEVYAAKPEIDAPRGKDIPF